MTTVDVEQVVEISEEEAIKIGFLTLNKIFSEATYMREVLWKSLELFFKKYATVADVDLMEYIDEMFGEHTGLTILNIFSKSSTYIQDRTEENYSYYIALKNSFYYDFSHYVRSISASPLALIRLAPASESSNIIRIMRADKEFIDVEINERNFAPIFKNLFIYLTTYLDKSDFTESAVSDLEYVADELKDFIVSDDYE